MCVDFRPSRHSIFQAGPNLWSLKVLYALRSEWQSIIDGIFAMCVCVYWSVLHCQLSPQKLRTVSFIFLSLSCSADKTGPNVTVHSAPFSMLGVLGIGSCLVWGVRVSFSHPCSVPSFFFFLHVWLDPAFHALSICSKKQMLWKYFISTPSMSFSNLSFIHISYQTSVHI